MTAKLDQVTIDKMRKAGINFVADIRWPGGGHSISVSVSDLEHFVSNPVAGAAKYLGGTEEQYLRWIETDGTPQCGAKTSKGTRCRNFVSGGIQQDFERWLELDGDYCQVHGGEPSHR